MVHQPQEIARGTRADSSRGFTEVPSPRNEQAWLANPFQALWFLKPAYEAYRKETPGREVTRQPACAVRPETWWSSWSPTSARGTLHARLLCPETPTSCRGEDARIVAAGTSLSSTQETARRPPKGSLTGVQNTLVGTFQFARDREAPPSGHDVTRVLSRNLRLPLSGTPPSSPPGLESFLAEAGVHLKWSTTV